MLPKLNNNNDLFSGISFLSINRSSFPQDISEINSEFQENSLNLPFELQDIFHILPNEENFDLMENNNLQIDNRNITIQNNSYKNLFENLKEKKFNQESREINKKSFIFEETSKSTKNSRKKPLLLKNKKSKEIIKQKENNKRKNRNCLIRKTKKIIFNTSINYINKVILKVYNGDIGKGVYQKFLRKVNRFENNNTKIIHNRELLNKTLKEILSVDINGRYTSSPADINREIIDKLLNEENEEKRKIFVNLFNKTFLEWLMILSEPKGELKKIYEKELQKSTKGKNELLDEIKELINNYEIEFLNKKPRKEKMIIQNLNK